MKPSEMIRDPADLVEAIQDLLNRRFTDRQVAFWLEKLQRLDSDKLQRVFRYIRDKHDKASLPPSAIVDRALGREEGFVDSGKKTVIHEPEEESADICPRCSGWGLVYCYFENRTDGQGHHVRELVAVRHPHDTLTRKDWPAGCEYVTEDMFRCTCPAAGKQPQCFEQITPEQWGFQGVATRSVASKKLIARAKEIVKAAKTGKRTEELEEVPF